MTKTISKIKRFAVIVLNWNGALDTIECIRSIQSADPAALPIIIDNGSTDNSFLDIKSAIFSASDTAFIGTFEDVVIHKDKFVSASAILIDGGENIGFAGGCNIGLKAAAAASLDATIFLNNDTIVEPAALTMLVSKLRSEPRWFAVLPLLTILGTDKIWNCGGSISRLGFRRYNYAGSIRSTITLPQEIPCTFFTGCCFAVRTEDFLVRGGFSERFFFGEEDFELSLWMKDHGLHALCITDSIVHHKVSASITRAAGTTQASKVFIHYLNRFIHMRLRFGTLLWIIWLLVYLPYISVLLIRGGIVAPLELSHFLSKLLSRAKRNNKVTREDFESTMRVRPW